MSSEEQLYLIEPGSIEFWMPWLAIIINHALFFIPAAILKDNGIVDIAWGFSFIIQNMVILGIRIQKGGVDFNLDSRTILINVLVIIYGLRMSTHIFMRTEKGNEDRRFAKIREILMNAGGACLTNIVSFFAVFMNTTWVISLINAPVLYVSMRSSDGKGSSLSALDFVGLLVWVIGISILITSDMQLTAFKAKRKEGLTNGERLCKTGLWQYSRHPNYFGEALLWWGFYLIAVSVDGGWVTFWSPILIFITVRYISGVPLVE